MQLHKIVYWYMSLPVSAILNSPTQLDSNLREILCSGNTHEAAVYKILGNTREKVLGKVGSFRALCTCWKWISALLHPCCGGPAPAAKLLAPLPGSLFCQPRKLTFPLLFAWVFRKGSWSGTWGKGRPSGEKKRKKKTHKTKSTKLTTKTTNFKRGMKLWGAIVIALSHWFKRIILGKMFAIQLRAIP